MQKSFENSSADLEKLLKRAAPEEYILFWQELLVRKKEENEKAYKESYLVFKIDEEHFALKASCVSQISIFKAFHRIPHMQTPFIAGLVNINGRLQLLISLVKLIQLQQVEVMPKTSFLITIADPNAPWSFQVGEVLGLFDMSKTSIQAPPVKAEKEASHYIKGMFACKGYSAALLDEQLLRLRLSTSL